MNINIYKSVLDNITPNKNLKENTLKKMIKASNVRMSIRYKRLLPIAVGFLVVVIGLFSYNKNLYDNKQIINQDNICAENKIVPDSKLLQITKYYEPFDKNKNGNSNYNYKIPSFPRTYNDLINNTNLIILCTVKDIGDYTRKSTKDAFGSRIYTVRVDKILYGKMEENINELIPIIERFRFDDFEPYTVRPSNTLSLNSEKQYVIYLTQKSDTGCYGLSFDGFGVFSNEYIDKESLINSLDDLEKQIQNAKEKNQVSIDVLYKYIALTTKGNFLK